MEPTPFLRPTALQQIRGFLAESDAGLPPWSSSDEALDTLVGQLHSRSGDDAFFARLTPFLEELRAGAARGEAGLASPDAELLGRTTIESMVAELRAGLRRAPAGTSPSILRSLLGERAAPLLCLALLATGLSACTQPAGNGSSSAEPGTPPPAGPTNAVPTPPPPTAGAAAPATDALVEMFKTRTPQEAAQELERVLDAGTPAAPSPEKPKPQIIRDFGSNSVALYKGVQLT